MQNFTCARVEFIHLVTSAAAWRWSADVSLKTIMLWPPFEAKTCFFCGWTGMWIVCGVGALFWRKVGSRKEPCVSNTVSFLASA